MAGIKVVVSDKKGKSKQEYEKKDGRVITDTVKPKKKK